jgi:aryl-alcohol dehydrogenase-like predicted oxidoreductase
MWATDDGKQKIEKIRKIAVLAADLGVSLTHLSIAWCLKNPQVSTVILGASKLSQLEDNLKSIEVLPLLTDSVMASIDAIVDNRPAGIDRF